MRLSQWRSEQGLTQQQLAEALDCSQPTVSYMERADSPTVPAEDLMVRIYKLTRGAVTPNDFYNLPCLAQLPLPIHGAAPLLERSDA